jgi:hypothetical protein
VPLIRLSQCVVNNVRVCARVAVIIGAIPLLGATDKDPSCVLTQHPWNPKLASAYEPSSPATPSAARTQPARADATPCTATDTGNPQTTSSTARAKTDCPDVSAQERPTKSP